MAEDDEDIEISTYGNDVVVMLAPYRGLWWLAPFRVTSEVQEGVKDGETAMASAPAHESSLCMSSLEGSPWVGVIRCCVEWREADAQYLGQDLEILLQHELVRARARHAEDGKERSLWSSDSSAKAGLGFSLL